MCTRQRFRADNRRNKWKLIGSKNRHPWGWGLHEGKYYKNRCNRAWRYYWKRFSEVYVDDPVYEPRLEMRGLAQAYSITDWKNW
jgi:hypothetical protein